MTYEQFLSALCLWREARGSSLPALTAIYHVILNRVADPAHRWPRTIPGAILQPYQFSSFLKSDPNVTKFPIDDGSADWKAWLDCCLAVSTLIGGDPTRGATNYESCAPDALPPWADPSKLTVTIGPFRFYRL